MAQYHIHLNYCNLSLRRIKTLGVRWIKLIMHTPVVKFQRLSEICKVSVNSISSCNEKAAEF
jgi:hypothetical protein